MKIWIALSFVAFAALASAKCPPCETMKWANCYGTPCQCFLAVDSATNLTLDCTKLIPKCFLMQAEMHRAREGQDTQTVGGKPASTDEKYNPECESDGNFKAKQCSNSEECWCVNSAGIRRTLKGDKNHKCEKLVKAATVNLRLTHKLVSTALDTTTLKADIADAINKRYKNFNKDLVATVEYKPTERTIVVNVKMRNQSGDLAGISDLAGMAYYMEKDVKGMTLFANEKETFEPTVGSQRLQIEDIKVNYIDEEPPDFPPRAANLSLSISILVVVVVFVMCLVIFLGIGCYFRNRNRRM